MMVLKNKTDFFLNEYVGLNWSSTPAPLCTWNPSGSLITYSPGHRALQGVASNSEEL